ncbi:MAG: insulinase family protein [Vicinamibacterales bacterium]|nr:insulinase family protein [Vicinamibacterales bacterium]
MTFRTRMRLLFLVLAMAAGPIFIGAQQPAATIDLKNAPLGLTIPVDPLITVGNLPNGLRYYVRQNKLPQARAELRLVVKAGSVLEDEDQRGLAHFVEHVAFNGTLHFPKQEITNFMQSLGMRFGAHVNAHTSFDETVYELQIPTSNPVVIDRSLTILEDFAHNVSFDPVEIDKERGVILEEWRLGLGAGERIQDAQFPVLLKGSRYADRLPIGKPDIIRNVNHDRLKQFYADWYRPDLMAVIAVGDFDKAAVEAQIRSRFASIPAAVSRKPRPDYAVPEQPGTTYSAVTDPEVTQTTISVFAKMHGRDQSTVGAYRQQMVERLFAGMLSARLDEITQQPNAPFLAARTGRGIFVRTEEATTLDALVAQGGVERGLAALFTEIDRVARFGFTAGELDRQGRTLKQFLENATVEKDKSPSGPLADEFIRNFLQGEPIPGIVYEFALNQRFLPEITLAELNALAKEWAPDRNRVVAISAPEKDKATLPDAAKMAAVIAASSGTPLTAYVDTVSTQPLLEPLPSPGRVATTSTNESRGITEWRLSNGVRVVLKPTTFKEDEILFRAVSPGGTSMASDSDFIAAETADEVVAQGGLGKLRSLDLNKVLAGRNVAVRADIGETEEGLSGGSSRKDLEMMFQLIYLTFTAPRPDPVAFGVFKEQLKVALANQDALPDTAFDDALNAAITQNHLRARPLKASNVDELNLDRSIAFYKDRFGDASDFTFVFVGSFDLATMRPLVERYLASLPSLHRNESAKDVGMRPPAGVVERQVRKGIEPKSQVSIVFTGPFQNDEMHRLTLRAMGEMLSGNLQRTLREDLGGTYGVSVEPRFTKRPNEEYRLTISFACDPARTESLVKTTFALIDEFKSSGPSEGQVADGREALMRDFETNSQRNGYLLGRLAYKYEYGEDVDEVFNIRPTVDRLTPALILDAARTYLDVRRYVEVTLLPEVRTPGAP